MIDLKYLISFSHYFIFKAIAELFSSVKLVT